MKTAKSDQLAQNIKSTCCKLQQEMEDKPYIRPGSGKAKVFNSLDDLKVIIPDLDVSGEFYQREPDLPDLTWDIE
jgi:hypothetical protein